MSNSATREVFKGLQAHLIENVASIGKVLEGFPSANDELDMPCISIDVGEPTYTPEMALGETIGTISDGKVPIKYKIGQYEWNLQVDIWAGSKKELHEIYEDVFLALNKNISAPGIILELENYHGSLCSYSLNGYRPENSEAGSQRREFRFILSVLAMTDAILEKDEYVIETTQLTVETPNVI